MIFQERMTSLNPVMRVGKQIEEAIQAHYRRCPPNRWKVRPWNPCGSPRYRNGVRAQQYPHQLSGGLRQRVMIAMAIAAGLCRSRIGNAREERQPGEVLNGRDC